MWRQIRSCFCATSNRLRAVRLACQQQRHTKQSQYSGQPKVLENRGRGTRLVQRVEMNAGHALAEQFPALVRGILDAELGDGFIVVTSLLQFGQQRFRQTRAAESDKLPDLRSAENGDDARNQRNGDAQFRQVIAELQVIAVVEEKLGDEEISAVVDLVLQS